MKIVTIVLIMFLATAVLAAEPPATYVKSCQSCHGADGKPTAVGQKMSAPELGGAEVQKLTDDQLYKSIASTEGHTKFPHGYEKKGMTAEQIKELVKFIRTLKK